VANFDWLIENEIQPV